MTSDKGVVERLTKTQREVLEAVSQAEYGVTMAEHYPPVKSLLARGLIAERRGRWSTTYVVTDEGRAALSPSTNSPER